MDDLTTNEKKEPWRITDLQSATWVAGKIREAQEAIARIQNDADTRHNETADWEERMSAEWKDRISFFESHLRPWLEIHMHEYTRKRSMPLPNGVSVGFRTVPAKVDIVDADRLIDEIKQYNLDGAIETVEKLVKSEVKKHLQSGVQFENASLTPPVDKFFVKEQEKKPPSLTGNQPPRVWGNTHAV